jgi:hypothetical protein
MISDSGITAKLLLVLTFIGAIALFYFVSQSGEREPTVSASVVTNVEQVAEMKLPEQQVQVLLPSGAVVMAWVPANQGFPFLVGTPVQVTPYRSRIFGKRTYWVEARRAKP